MKAVRYHPAARRELREGIRYYDRRQPGLGERWLRAVKALLARICLNPNTGRIVAKKARKRLVARFPYDVVFVSRPAQIFIVAVAHHRRHPDYWKPRLTPDE